MRSHLNFLSLFSLLIVSLFMTSCQKDELSDGSELQLDFRDAHSFSYSLNPAQVGDSVQISFDAGNGADCGIIHLQVSGPDGEGWMGGPPVSPDSGVATMYFIPDAPGEYRVRAKYTRTGNPKNCPHASSGWLEAEELLSVEGDTTGGGPDTTCEYTFTGEAISCDSAREVVFVYTPGDDVNNLKIQGGLTNGTEGDPVVTVDGADLDVTIRTPGNSSNRIIKLEGSALACVPITVTITWTSTNQGDVITGEWSASGAPDVDPLECE